MTTKKLLYRKSPVSTTIKAEVVESEDSRYWYLEDYDTRVRTALTYNEVIAANKELRIPKKIAHKEPTGRVFGRKWCTVLKPNKQWTESREEALEYLREALKVRLNEAGTWAARADAIMEGDEEAMMRTGVFGKGE